jgi:K+-transporting ATPase ATPase C chain
MAGLRMLLWMTLLCGLIYPTAFTLFARLAFPGQAEGSLVKVDGVLRGSELIAQKFTGAGYFWSRPSAVDYNPQPSGGSNLGPAASDLKKAVDGRYADLTTAAGAAGSPPQDLLFASASGLDPHISPEAARYQETRVAKARKFDAAHLATLKDLVERSVEAPTLGFLGQARVNVLKLNLALDSMR